MYIDRTGSPPKEGFLSTSDALGTLRETLAPVKLSKEDNKEYEQTFFARGNRGPVKNGDIAALVAASVSASTQLNNAVRILSEIINTGGRLEDQDPEYTQTYFQNRLGLMEGTDSAVVEENIKSFMGSLNSGQYHTIEDSKKYPGGKDILFTGTPSYSGDGASTSAGFVSQLSSYESILASKPGSGFYEESRLRNYEAEIAIGAKNALTELHQIIFKSALDVESAHEWKKVQLDFDFEFESLNQVITRNVGLDLKIFSNLDVNRNLQKNFSLMLMVLPEKNLINKYSEYFSVLSYKEDNPDDTSIEAVPPVNAELVTPEAALARKFSASIAINLPKEYVDYISQTTDGSLNLYALTNWVSQWSKVYLRPKNSRKEGGAHYARLPRYIIPASKNNILIQHREENGLPKDDGRVDEDRICINPRGLISFMPRASDMDFDNASEYEKDMEAALEASYRAGAPLTDSQTLLSKAFSVSKNDHRIEKAIRSKKDELNRYKGTLLAFNWDYNISLQAGSSNAFTQIATDLNGTTTPSALALADYLGYDFSQEGERSNSKTFEQSLEYMIPSGKFQSHTEKDVPSGMRDTPRLSWIYNKNFKQLLMTYLFLRRKEKVMPVSRLIKDSFRELEIDNIATSPLNKGLYGKWIKEDGTLSVEENNREVDIIYGLLGDALIDSSGISGTNLHVLVAEEVGYANVASEIRDHPAFFDKDVPMHQFGNVYNYLGGLVFRKVCEEITKADPRDLMRPLQEFNPVIQGYSIPFNTVSQVIMPLAYMFAKYVPNALNIFEQAEQESEQYTPDTSIDVDDIRMPGIAEGSQVFPHQIKGHTYLRKHPKHALLDIHPGGGKTITLLLDIGCMVGEGVDIRAGIIAPDKLCANWCEDLAKITKGSWNAIPITKESIEAWGEERLEEMIRNAPKNTICVIGINFLKRGKQDISYGPRKLKIYAGAEFVKRLGLNYVALDESHKAKKYDPGKGKISAVHNVVKQIFTMPSIEYSRELTGTFIHGILEDAVGQAALFSAHIFRTPDDFNIDASAPDGAVRVRSKLAQHASVITIKRKEWAFMLPSPIDTFIAVDMINPEDQDTLIFSEVYNTLLEQTVEELEDKIKSSGKAVRSDDDEDDSDSDSPTEDPDFDEDEDLGKIDPLLFEYYMQRLEQFLVDPWSDPAFEEIAKQANVSPDFVSPKIHKIVERLDRHFNTESYDATARGNRVFKWEPGMTVRELAVVEHNGQRYMRRRLDDGIVEASRRDTPPSNIPPDQDSENWKPEALGKVLIFCRYTRTTDTIFKNLPPKYKGVARKFHGSAENAWQNIDDFKTDPNIKILVANEQAITEGHNLQMASRIIRVETPWSPGDYEQSTARIFRPDPSAAKIENGKPGDMRREVIYIDWLMAKGSMEVAKIARLMWKTVEKVKFDEKGNERYDPMMEISLPKIKMNVKTLISAATDGIDAFMEHFEAKAQLNDIESSEFHEMRKSTLATMRDLPMVEALPEFRNIENLPILSNQKMVDKNNHGLTKFTEWYGQWTEKNFDNQPALLDSITKEQLSSLIKGLPVRTEFGTGVVVGWTKLVTETKEDGTQYFNHSLPVSGLKVRYSGNDEIGSVSPKKVFVATKVTQEDKDRFFSTNKPWATESERKRMEREARKEDRKTQKRSEEEAKRRKSIKKRSEEERDVGKKANKRRNNIKNGRPVNEGVVSKVKKLDVIEKDNDIVRSDEADMNIELIPSVYNGFLALHVNATDPDSKNLKNLGFQPFGEYAYCEFKRYMHLDKALDYIEEKMELDRPTAKRLEVGMEAFEEETRMLGFDLRLGAKIQSDLPNFFRTRHRQSKNKRVVKIYPVVLPDRVRLTVDIASNPLIRKHLNKKMLGAGPGGKWKVHPGMAVFFAVNKSSAKAKIRELIKEGYNITNMEKVIEEVRDLKLVRSAAHNRELKAQL